MENKVVKIRFEYAATCNINFDAYGIEFFKWKEVLVKDIESEWIAFREVVDSTLKKEGWKSTGIGMWWVNYAKGANINSDLDKFNKCTGSICFITINIGI